MKKVTEQTASAFLDRERCTVSNTCSTGEDLILHGNVIASWFEDTIILGMCGWPSVTTRERLNGVLELLQAQDPEIPWLRVAQRKGKQKLLLRTSWGADVHEFDFDPGRGQLWIDTRTRTVSNWTVTPTGATEERIFWKTPEPSA